jgi:taurine dioxygenase
VQDLHVRKVGYALGARLSGLDASVPLDAGTVDFVRKALLEHMVLVLPDHDLSMQQFQQFCTHFGELDAHRGSMNNHPDAPGVVLVASKPMEFGGRRGGGYGKADYWHTSARTRFATSSA